MVSNTRRTTDTRRIRRLKSPQGIEVQANDDGVPIRLRLGVAWCDVTLARRPWRIDQYWWRSDPVNRVYFRVIPEDSPALTIYKDLKTGEWSRQEY